MYLLLEEKFSSTGLSLLTGKLLGDGNFFQSPGRQARFPFSHIIDDIEWTYYCYDKLSEYFSLAPPKYRKLTDPRISCGFSEQYYVQSKSNELLTQLKNIWYP